MIASTEELIDSYVQNDTNGFCTYNEFKAGVSALKEFCSLRAEMHRVETCRMETPDNKEELLEKEKTVYQLFLPESAHDLCIISLQFLVALL